MPFAEFARQPERKLKEDKPEKRMAEAIRNMDRKWGQPAAAKKRGRPRKRK